MDEQGYIIIAQFLLFSHSLVPYRKIHSQGYIIIGGKISLKKIKAIIIVL
jgi:hypothetical protein